MSGDQQHRPPIRCLLSVRFSATGGQHHFALRQPAEINLALEDRGVYRASSRHRSTCCRLPDPVRFGLQSADTNLSLQFESQHLTRIITDAAFSVICPCRTISKIFPLSRSFSPIGNLPATLSSRTILPKGDISTGLLGGHYHRFSTRIITIYVENLLA